MQACCIPLSTFCNRNRIFHAIGPVWDLLGDTIDALMDDGVEKMGRSYVRIHIELPCTMFWRCTDSSEQDRT
jgi:hypothetical protein